MKTKEKLTKAFAQLRKAGFVAKQNFSCCGSCASYEIATAHAKLSKAKRAKVRGAVFYHAQDNEVFKRGRRVYPRGEERLFISYGTIEARGCEPTVLTMKEVGAFLVQVLRENGIECKWDGDPSIRVEVKVEL